MYTPIILGNGLAGYNYLARTLDEQLDTFAKSSQVARDTQHMRDEIAKIETIDDLMNDRQMLRVALGAFGLDEDLNNSAFIRKVLESDLNVSTSLANKLSDKRYLAFAKAFNFGGTSAITPASQSAEQVALDLSGIKTVDDILGNRSLLRASLKSLGLEESISNTYFLHQVLESDPDDPSSFVNQLADKRYVALAETFGFAEKNKRSDSVFGFVDLFRDKVDALQTADDLLNDSELLASALGIFGLEGDKYNTAFLTDVLNSDLYDPASFANQLDDGRYAAFARVFDFAEQAAALAGGYTYDSRLQNFIDKIDNPSNGEVKTKADLSNNVRILLATIDFFDLPPRDNRVELVNRVIASDRGDPYSLVNSLSDERYRAFYDAFDFAPEQTGRTYPEGFADAVVRNYLDRQFEVQIGEQDGTMRIAIAMQRELENLLANTTTNNSRWYGVMASEPLRDVFETVLNLPGDSFGALNLDRQLKDFKARAVATFGTDELSELGSGELLKEIRSFYLLRKEASLTSTASSNPVVILFAQTASTGGLFG